MKIDATLALAALLAVACSAPASARGRSTPPKVIPLTEPVVRKVMACHRAVEQAEERASGGSSEVYRNRTRLTEAALARCGFPRAVVWRDARHSVQVAYEGLRDGGAVDETRTANRAVVAPFSAQLARLFAE